VESSEVRAPVVVVGIEREDADEVVVRLVIDREPVAVVD